MPTALLLLFKVTAFSMIAVIRCLPIHLSSKKLLNEGNNYFALTEKYDRGITFSASGTYGYKGKYIANAVLNYEGSNTAGRGTRSRWLPTWNVGAKWNIDREDFFQQQKHQDPCPESQLWAYC